MTVRTIRSGDGIALLGKRNCGRVPLSPLRYPGGKTRFVPQLVRMLDEQTFPRVIEPFAGGASVSLGLLEAGVVDKARISDADPLIAAFWISATERSEELVSRMYAEPVTVARWTYWKNRRDESLTTMGRAMKTLYLNRTTFSGLIRHGSVLGGLDQDARIADGETVAYPIGSRFNKDALAASIRRIGQWHSEGRITAHHELYAEALTASEPDDLVYLDPPYVEKSDALYGTEFGTTEHCALAADVARLNSPVIVSYDDLPLIRNLYAGMEFQNPQWAYGMGGSKRSREILITNNVRLEHRAA